MTDKTDQDAMQQLMTAYCATDDKIACLPSKRHFVIGMELNEKLVGAGMVHLRVFQGEVSILGYNVPRGIYFDLFSPRWSNLMAIQASDTSASPFQAPCSDLTVKRWNLTHNDPIDPSDEAAADTLAQEIAMRFPIVLVLRAMHLTYGNLSSYFDATALSDALPGFRIIRHKEVNVEKPKSKKLKTASDAHTDALTVFSSITTIEPHPVKEILVPPSWTSSVASILESFGESNRKVLVCGAKGVGKSTFSRYLVNRLLNVHRVVAYLDTDVGQPELAAPGVLSLHFITTPLLGPGYTHLQPAFRSYFFGFSSPKADPTLYMNAVEALVAAYASHDTFIPLVINTDGWIKSMGYDLLNATLTATSPAHVVQVVALSKAKSFDVPISSEWKLHPIEMWDADPPQPTRSSKELRQFRLHAYFLGDVPVPGNVSLVNVHCTSEQTRYGRLLSTIYPQQVPYRVPFANVALRISGASVPPSQVLHVLNGSVVGLCIHPHDVKPANDGPLVVLDNPMVPCVGHGIVRSIDVERREYHIVTPVPRKILQHVNLLVRGHISLAFQLLDQSAVYGHTPYVVVDVLPAEGTGASLMESRNNLKRKKEMT
ncbi:Polynucleotide 5'-hydroxyl-kinase nol9 [Aphanomyces cochlioides]|nr:Polynucleotide 5'-hydroxyl-kinase nol9 [Aphanomyces cochlioides]